MRRALGRARRGRIGDDLHHSKVLAFRKEMAQKECSTSAPSKRNSTFKILLLVLLLLLIMAVLGLVLAMRKSNDVEYASVLPSDHNPERRGSQEKLT